MATAWTKLSVATHFGGNDPDVPEFLAELDAADPLPAATHQGGLVTCLDMTLDDDDPLRVDEDAVCIPTDIAPTGVELADLVTVANDHVPSAQLDVNKATRARQVDRRTAQLVREGFVHSASGATLSATPIAGLSYAAYKLAPTTFPLKFKNIDNTDASISIANQGEMDSLYAEYETHLETQRESGRDLVEQIIAAVDQAALDAVADAR